MKKVVLLSSLYLSIFLQYACSASQTSSSIVSGDNQLIVKTVTNKLLYPWAMDFLPNGRLLITEHEGRLLSLEPSTGDYFQISGLPSVYVYGQAGLFDVAVHPDFKNNQLVYFSYAHQTFNRTYTTRVARAKLVKRKLVELKVLFEAQPTFSTSVHFGGALLFSHSGALYVTVGDRRQRDLAQDDKTHMGKVLRIIDEDSLIKDLSKNASVISKGHRNPQGLAIAPNGMVWLAEHGPQGGDEINLVNTGENYGWPIITYGEEYGGGKIGTGTHQAGLTQPIHYYVPSIGTAGITYYSGKAMPFWQDSLFVAGLKSRSLSRIQISDDKAVLEERLLEKQNLRLRDVKQGPDDLLYVLSESGELLQLSPALKH